MIRFTRVTKSFPINRGQVLFRESLLRLLRPSRRERFSALQDLTLEVESGTSVGIIGHNGAGKSTLLSLAAGLSQPDSGRVEVTGRVAALLELGAGFHPDLTGAENIFINAALLGFTRREAREKFDGIVEFSGVREFIHQPLRTYSSGMSMRLAFSVAISTDPDVLVIDEILGVGDSAFQARCMEKIMDLRSRGRTILCASHSDTLLTMLCDRALWLDHGRMAAFGRTRDVLDAYADSVAGRQAVAARVDAVAMES